MSSDRRPGNSAAGFEQGDRREVAARDVILFALTFVAGAVDAISFLGLGQVFTANMTGNTIFMGIAAGSGRFLAAGRSAVALLGFAAGALVAGKLVDPGKQKIMWSRRITRVIVIETAFAVIFAVAWFYVRGRGGGLAIQGLIAISALSMGLQSGAARRLSVSGVSTVVVTSTLTGLMAELAALGAIGPNQLRWTVVLISLFAGAAVSAIILSAARPYAGLLPAIMLCTVSYFAIRRFHNIPR